MQRAGRPFVLLPEAATKCIEELQAQGRSVEYLARHDRPGLIDFETKVLGRIIDGVATARRQHQNTNTIIAADRIDIAAYVKPEEYTTILHRLGRAASLLETEVDTVLYLPTLAHHDPIGYETLVSTNTARYEQRANQAIATCNANFETVKHHPDVRIYEQQDFAQKIGQVISDVMAIQDGISSDVELQ